MKKILLIDDDNDILEIIKESIEEIGSFNITTANCGNKAMELLQNNRYHLVLTDILIPGFNGLKIIDFIKSNFPETKIIACSGGGESGPLLAGIALEQAISEGAFKTLLKPFTTSELQNSVLNCMKK